ncbi:MAG: hypothetical protein AAGN66_28105 [Acidobacteriota bacterium]
MRLDVVVHMPDGSTPGEISTEVSGAEGEPIFIPWRTTREFVQGRPYPLAGFSGDLDETPVRIQLIHRKQLTLAEALDVPGCDFVFEKPSYPPKEHRRSVNVNLEQRQITKLTLLAERDGIAMAAWIRSLVERELHLRRMV